MRLATFFDTINEDAEADVQVAQFAEVVHGIVLQYMQEHGFEDNWGFVNIGDRGRTEPNYELAANLGSIISRMGASDKLVNPPEWYRPEFMGKLYLVLAKVERGVDKENKTMVKGGIGHMRDSGTPVMVLYMLLEDNPNAFVDTRFSGMKVTFVHEFTHYLDEMRTIDTWKDRTPTYSADAAEEFYFSHPKEFQAYYIEAVHQLLDMMKPRVEKWDAFVRDKYFGGGFDQFLAEFMDIFPDNYKLAPKFDRKLKRRIYKLYTELLDRQQQVQ